MTCEQFIILYLSGRAPVRVCGNVPADPPERFISVEKTGSTTANRIQTDTLTVQSWAESRDAAAQLNELTKQLMASAAAQPEISAVRCTGDYNYPDTATKHERYRAVFAVTHFLD